MLFFLIFHHSLLTIHYSLFTFSLLRVYHQPEPIPMNVNDLDGRIGFQVFPKACHKDIHAAGGEIIFFSPDLLKSIVAGQDTVFCVVKHFQKFGFLWG